MHNPDTVRIWTYILYNRKKETEMNTIALKACLTKTQYKYWVEYFDNDMTLSDIAIKYDVHITTICHVLKNARKRIDEKYGKMV